jgi:glycerophosphoryl diester phosphodiesterase|tara:strand:+ start:90463 stop:91185 length:723 start_codon:yes stop_codon:yes gene_type:complete
MAHNWLKTDAFAHRGLHGPRTGFVENSLSAFKAATDLGYGFELDVLLSSDDVAVVIHDATLDRLTGQDGKTINHTAMELSKTILTGTNETIPMLEDVLEQTKGAKPILIEIKGDQGSYSKIAKAVWRVIKDYTGDVAVMSFYPEIIEYFKVHHPDVTRGLVATPRDDGSLPSTYFDPTQQIKLIKTLDADFIAYDIRALPNEVTEYCRDRDIPVLTWTVRSDQDLEKARKNTDNIIFEQL